MVKILPLIIYWVILANQTVDSIERHESMMQKQARGFIFHVKTNFYQSTDDIFYETSGHTTSGTVP